MKLFAMFAAAAAVVVTNTSVSFALEKVRFGTNWLAQGAHGGFYQAIANGAYERHGLEVEIIMGGPQVNNRPMLAAGRLDFLLTANLLLSFDNIRNEIPTTAVAAFFQKDPQALMAHEGTYKDFPDLASAPAVLISKDMQFSTWKWLTGLHGFKDDQLRPYTFNLAPFLLDKAAVQQAYATVEPLYAKAEGAAPVTYLLADYGWNTYAQMIETRNDLVENRPELVQSFIDASIEGWYDFLYGDRAGAYALIIEDNPEMTVEKLDAEVGELQRLGIIDSGDALEKGLGALDLERVSAFHDLTVQSGIIESGAVDLAKVATDRFVNKGHGLDIRRELKPE